MFAYFQNVVGKLGRFAFIMMQARIIHELLRTWCNLLDHRRLRETPNKQSVTSRLGASPGFFANDKNRG
jgi:hypothetical protein